MQIAYTARTPLSYGVRGAARECVNTPGCVVSNLASTRITNVKIVATARTGLGAGEARPALVSAKQHATPTSDFVTRSFAPSHERGRVQA